MENEENRAKIICLIESNELDKINKEIKSYIEISLLSWQANKTSFPSKILKKFRKKEKKEIKKEKNTELESQTSRIPRVRQSVLHDNESLAYEYPLILAFRECQKKNERNKNKQTNNSNWKDKQFYYGFFLQTKIAIFRVLRRLHNFPVK